MMFLGILSVRFCLTLIVDQLEVPSIPSAAACRDGIIFLHVDDHAASIQCTA